MSEKNTSDETQPVRPEGSTEPASPAPAARRGFRERFRAARQSDGNRAYSLGALIASALAGIIVGGIGMATVHAVTDDGPRDRGGWVQQRDERGPGFGDGGMRGGPRGVPGQTPPSTPPDNEDSGSSS